jgi:2-polyprenyl-3-methyl-5-hydroxy-6-metoxy-1,4-benzoquinol methylase
MTPTDDQSAPTTTLACRRCGASATSAVLHAVDRNRAAGDRSFEYARCDACGVTWLPDVPEDLAAYYPDDYHASLAPADLAAAIKGEAPRLELITRHVSPGRMLEIGPSQGVFAAAARAAGFDVVTLEMDADCCEYLEREVGVRAIQTPAPERVIPTLEPSRAAVMWHVIEHVPEPWAILRAIALNLEPGGVLALATPNPKSLQSRLLGARWVHLDAPRHLTLIPLPALRDEAASLGLELVSATTSDPTGLMLNRLGWERSFLRAPAMRPNPRLAHTIGRICKAALGEWEQRGLRGAAYTTVFRKLQAG